MHNEGHTGLRAPHGVLRVAGVDGLVLRHDAPQPEPGLARALHHGAVLPGPGEHGPGVSPHLALKAHVLPLPRRHVHGVRQEVGLDWKWNSLIYS